MAFRYYVMDLFNGVIKGTDDKDKANNYAESEDFSVLDAKSNEWIQPDGIRESIKEAKAIR